MSAKNQNTAQRAAAVARCELRRSSAASRHVSARFKRTRGAVRRSAVRDQFA